MDVLKLTPEAVRASIDDHKAVALTIMFEGASEPVEGRIAIGNVIRNRFAHPKRFSRTYSGVCTQRAQFSCWWKFGGESNYLRLLQAARALISGYPLPFSAIESEIFTECQLLAEGIIGGQLRDNTKAAVNYYAPRAMKPAGRVPKEAIGRSTIKIGSQLFYSAT